jgi:hypothetical protein
MQYRKKPVVIETIQFNGHLDNAEEINKWSGYKVKIDMIGDIIKMSIPTLEGDMTASAGDFIIKGVKGEFYPCKPDIFEATYEKID